MRYFLVLCLVFIFALFVPSVSQSFMGKAASPAVKAGEKALEKAGMPLMKKGVKEAIGGDSAKLAKAIGLAPKSGYQAHHIIPVECKSHPILNKIGFDLDQAANGIALPSRPGMSNLPVHRGYHAGYSNAVKRDLDAIPKNLSEAETVARVNGVMKKYRDLIESGKPLYDSGVPNAWR